MERLNVMVPVEIPAKDGREKKTKWLKVGVAFPNKQDGWNVNLDIPVGVQRFILVPPNDESGERRERRDQDDDDLPGRR